jgi:hypothetical protein
VIAVRSLALSGRLERRISQRSLNLQLLRSNLCSTSDIFVGLKMECLEQSRSAEGRESLRVDGHLKNLALEHVSTDDWDRKYQIVQCLRNCLISSEANAHCLLEEGFLHQIVQHLILLEQMKDQAIATRYCLAALQFIANFVTSQETCAATFWKDFGIEMISCFLSLSVSLRSDPSVGATIAILHSCTSRDSPGSRTRKDQFLSGEESLRVALISLSSSTTLLPIVALGDGPAADPLNLAGSLLCQITSPVARRATPRLWGWTSL